MNLKNQFQLFKFIVYEINKIRYFNQLQVDFIRKIIINTRQLCEY